MQDPDENWTVAKQKSFLEDQLNKATIPPERRSSPQLMTDSLKTTLMLDILFRDYVDISFGKSSGRCRRVMTPPSFSTPIVSGPSTAQASSMSTTDFEVAFPVRWITLMLLIWILPTMVYPVV
jgi:hypothetical protein